MSSTSSSTPQTADRVAKLVCFGHGGDVVHLSRHSTISGWGTPETPHAARTQDGGVEYPDGTPVIDKRPAIATDAGYRCVYRGPMVDVDIEDGVCDRCLAPDPLFAAAVAGNGFGALLGLQAISRNRGESRGPLDSVSIAEYINVWRAVGARIGCYLDNAIVWEAVSDAS